MYRRVLFLLVFACAAAGCSGDSGVDQPPEEVWIRFVEAVNDADVESAVELLDQQIAWTWNSSLLGIHRSAVGREETRAGIEDLVQRGVTFDSTLIDVVGTTLTAETIFMEPGLAEFFGGQALLQVDVVDIRDGRILSWECTADGTVPLEN